MASARWATPLDSIFLIGETPETLMHVASMAILTPPADAGRTYLSDLIAEMRSSPIEPPWTYRLQTQALMHQPLHRWVEDDGFEVEYHIRHSALPSPGGERELGVLVSRLHSNQLDFRRPPWEMHVIEGLEGGRFAIYTKIHHSLIDGYTGMKLLQRGMSTSPDDRQHPFFFSRNRSAPSAKDKREAQQVGDLASLIKGVTDSVGSLPTLARSLVSRQFRASSRDATRAVGSYEAPNSILNGRTGRSRRFATQKYEISRLKAVAKAGGGTLNDALLAICAGGLRSFLTDLDALPAKSLIAFLPVNVRPKGSQGGGNAVGATLVALATEIEDPVERFARIVASTRAAKDEMSGMTANEIIAYSGLLLAPAGFQVARAMTGLPSPIPLTLNLCISNVPGPTEPLHLRGSRMEAIYPVSIPGHSMALNITAHSYAGFLDIGFIGCRESLPSLQRLAVHTGAALDELERVLGVGPA